MGMTEGLDDDVLDITEAPIHHRFMADAAGDFGIAAVFPDTAEHLSANQLGNPDVLIRQISDHIVNIVEERIKVIGQFTEKIRIVTAHIFNYCSRIEAADVSLQTKAPLQKSVITNQTYLVVLHFFQVKESILYIQRSEKKTSQR